LKYERYDIEWTIETK